MARRVTSSQLKSYSSYSKTNNLSNIKPTNNSNSNVPVNTNYETRLAALEQKLNQIKSCNCDTSAIINMQNRLTTLESHEFSVEDSFDISQLIQKLTDYGYFKYDQNASDKQVKVFTAPYKTNADLLDESVTVSTPYSDVETAKNNIYVISMYGGEINGRVSLNDLPREVTGIFHIEPYKLTIYYPFIIDATPETSFYFSQKSIITSTTVSKSIWHKSNDNTFTEQPIEFIKHPYTETINNVNFKVEIDFSNFSLYYTITFPENIITVKPNNKFISHSANSNIINVHYEIDSDKLGINDFSENKFILECDSINTHYVIKFII